MGVLSVLWVFGVWGVLILLVAIILFWSAGLPKIKSKKLSFVMISLGLNVIATPTALFIGVMATGYGYQLWTCEITNSNNKIEYYYANGLYGQYIFIVPKLNIMAVAKSYLQDDQSSAPKLFFEELLRSWKDE